MMNGTLIRGQGGFYTVRTDEGNEYVLRAKKKFRRAKITPLVGDKILFTKGEISDEHGWVEEILERTSVCLRPPVANVTLLAIVISSAPEADLLLVDKLLAYAFIRNIKTLIVVSKEDIASTLSDTIKEQYKKAQTNIISVSAKTGENVAQLKEMLKGETVCFSGQSGVGKSTLLNALFALNEKTGEISKKISRGKNTTRHAELFEQEGIKLIDTPGFSLLDVESGIDPVAFQDAYPELLQYKGQCYFTPCYHVTEPKCAVTEAIEKGELNKERIERYRLLLKEIQQAWKKRYD